jgi:hypothetical protein
LLFTVLLLGQAFPWYFYLVTHLTRLTGNSTI